MAESTISSSVPSLVSIVEYASKGSVEAVLTLLAKRQDYTDQRKFTAAAAATQALGDKRATLGGAELIGQTSAGIIPQTPDWLGQAIWEYACQQSQKQT